MATIRERIDSSGKKSYHVQVRIKGFPPQTKSFETKSIAKQWAAQVETELRAGRYMPRVEAQRHTVKELLEEYRQKILIPKKPQEVRNQGPQLDWWIKKLGAYSLADITPAAIAQCRDELLSTPIASKKVRKNIESTIDGGANPKTDEGDQEAVRFRKPATVVRYMALLSHAFNVAVKEWQWMQDSPMSKVSKPKVNNERTRFLSKDELFRLLEATRISSNLQLHTILLVALSTGMRFSEILELRWREILVSDNQNLMIFLENTKNGDRRSIPLVENARDLIAIMRNNHLKENRGKVKGDDLLFPSKKDPKKHIDIRTAFETSLRRAQIEDFHFHDLRHTAGSYLAMDGATLREISEILGHKDPKTTMRYSHFSKEHIAKRMTKMSRNRFGDLADGTPTKRGSTDDE